MQRNYNLSQTACQNLLELTLIVVLTTTFNTVTVFNEESQGPFWLLHFYTAAAASFLLRGLRALTELPLADLS